MQILFGQVVNNLTNSLLNFANDFPKLKDLAFKDSIISLQLDIPANLILVSKLLGQ